MITPPSPFAVGIDLGTTHCALASVASARGRDGMPEPFAIPQIVAPGESSARPLLPSFVYLPAPGEFESDAFRLPWSEVTHQVVGEFARSKGATTPSRLVSSAKSWLSHEKVDRSAPILPFGAPESVPKLSPVRASAEYLTHLRKAWDAAHPETPLAEQDVVLTVPASFDAVARDLTLDAATQAGLTRPPRLLEEPQAALYDWVAQNQSAWREQVDVGDRILVVDIGGGTTDFSLIAVSESEGSLELERVAVGDHILLGGDNMDLALAYTVRAKLEAEGKKLDDWQMVALTHGCRVAKEKLLSDQPPEACPIVIPGRSSRLIGGSIRTELTLEQLRSVLLDGFLPEVPRNAPLKAPPRMGLSTLGLPYASDPAITRHLASFLNRAAAQVDQSASPGAESSSGSTASFPGDSSSRFPTKILFNGGVTRSPVVRDRLLSLLSSWAQSLGQKAPVPLAGTDAELAVSRGAAYFAQAVQQGGLRIRSVTVRSHYIGIQRAELAVPGIPPRVDAVCVAPFGLEEGAEVALEQSFGLVLGEPVSFRFFSSATRSQDTVGTVVDPAELTELAPLETTLTSVAAEDSDATSSDAVGDSQGVVEVRLQARLTEIGTLELAAVDVSSGRRWKLSFNIVGD